MIKKVDGFISGNICPRCGFEKLYELGDHRFKCASCQFRYSGKKLESDLTVLHYFSLEILANMAKAVL
jgi:uncharacterized protein (DUF983 family)